MARTAIAKKDGRACAWYLFWLVFSMGLIALLGVLAHDAFGREKIAGAVCCIVFACALAAWLVFNGIRLAAYCLQPREMLAEEGGVLYGKGGAIALREVVGARAYGETVFGGALPFGTLKLLLRGGGRVTLYGVADVRAAARDISRRAEAYGADCQGE